MEANKVSEKDERATSQRLFHSDQAPPLRTTVPCQSAFTQLDELEYSCVETITGTGVSITSIIQYEQANNPRCWWEEKTSRSHRKSVYEFPCLAAKNYLAHFKT